LIAAPEFPDEEKTRVAATVYRIGLALIPLALLGALVIVVALERPLPRLAVALGYVGVVSVSLVLARFGRVKASALLFVAATWLSLAAGLVVSRDVSTPALSGFVLSIAAAALLLGARSAWGVALLSAIAAPIIVYFDLHLGVPPGPPELDRTISLAIAIVQSSIFCATAALVTIAVRHAERARAQARLSELRFRSIADHAPDMITESDADGTFTYANPMAMSGSRLTSMEELGRERVGVWMHPEDRQTIVDKFREIATHGGSARVAFRTLDATGRVGWLESTGARYTDAEGRNRVVSVTRDVSKQHEAEAALRESEARYRVLAEHAPDMVIELDATGRVMYANPRALESIGYTLDELKCMEVTAALHPDDREACARAISEVLANGGPTRLVHRFRRKDGADLWVLSSAARHVSSSGETRLIGHSRDLTAELSLQEQLRESQKMDAIGRLAGGVAHDFNNLLTVIGGYASVLEGSLESGSGAAAAHEIVDATERAAALTRQLLLLTRRQLAQPGVVDPNAALRGLEPILRSILPERIRLELDLERDVPAVELEPSQLDQVLLNLALNARDAMPASGCLRIEMRLRPPGRFVQLSVSDTGQGMDEATRARAFEPFFTTKPPGAGTGLGLSTSYGIVRQAGGSIALDSAPGQGTRVEISLPACAASPTPASHRPRADASAATREASILLVEDDASVRRLLAILLESAGYRVTAAADGAEALAITDESQRRFDLLLSDYVMPGLSGLELANELRGRWPELRVVLMTGHAVIPGAAVSELPHGAELLGKPFTREQLQRVVTGMLSAPV
jgi:PAS domain S-box-containing protein